MEKPTFLKYEKPLLTCMVQAEHPDRIKELIALSRAEGAEAFGMCFCKMKPEYRIEKTYRELFEFAAPAPIYVTNYRGRENGEKDDETLGEELCELAACGATLCDVMGDFFDPCEGQLTVNSVAVNKQTELIRALHERGAEVVMSSHIHKFTPADRILEIALAHQSRGADICKIVTGAETMEQQIENLRILHLLKETLHIPVLLLSSGECRILRRIGSEIGNCMTLCVYEHDAFSTENQPLLRDMVKIRELLGE